MPTDTDEDQWLQRGEGETRYLLINMEAHFYFRVKNIPDNWERLKKE